MASRGGGTSRFAQGISSRNALDIFIGKLDTRIEFEGEVKAGKTLSSRSLWFSEDGPGYIVRIGRNGFEIADSKLFEAADLDAVVEVLKASKGVIHSDTKLQTW